MTQDKEIISITLKDEIEYYKRVNEEEICKRIEYQEITIEYLYGMIDNRRRNGIIIIYRKIEINEE